MFVRLMDGEYLSDWEMLYKSAYFISFILSLCYQVIHRRREQSLDEFGDSSNHFEFEWEVFISFDRQMEQLRSATVRINRLDTVETIDAEKLALLRRTFIEGLIVI